MSATHPDSITATIDLKVIAANYRALMGLAPGTTLAGTVKADGYGLGAIPISKTLYAEGCRHFYVAQFGEGLALRAALPRDARIAVLGGIPKGEEKQALQEKLEAVINEPAALERLQNFARAHNTQMSATLHLDTGMNRLGLTQGEWDRCKDKLDGIGLTHLLSHLACADEPGHSLNEEQRACFVALTQDFPETRKSFANSCGLFLGRAFHFDEARPGRALSGMDLPAGINNPLRPALTLTTPIVQLRTVERDGTMGYGATQTVKKGMRLATLAGGYADGLHRALSNRDGCTAHHFHIGGTPVPLVGRVSMDFIVVDVSALPESVLRLGTEVEIAGANQSIDTLALSAGTIGYELMTHIAPRVQRRYIA